MRDIIMGISGASGAVYARRLAQCLAAAGDVRLHVVISPPARRVMAAELGIERFSLEALLDGPADDVRLYDYRDVGATIASGSFRASAMVICPCSSHSLAAIANGLADNLITRAALVTLKEARRLVVVPREMPLSAIELENMLKLARAGAIVAPACPGFYLRPGTIDELVDFVAGRVLDLLGVEHDLAVRWRAD